VFFPSNLSANGTSFLFSLWRLQECRMLWDFLVAQICSLLLPYKYEVFFLHPPAGLVLVLNVSKSSGYGRTLWRLNPLPFFSPGSVSFPLPCFFRPFPRPSFFLLFFFFSLSKPTLSSPSRTLHRIFSPILVMSPLPLEVLAPTPGKGLNRSRIR